MTAFELWIPGRPVPQGSATIQRFNTAHRGTVVSSNKDRLMPWRATIAATAQQKLGDAVAIDAPCRVTLQFRFARPKTHYGSGRNAGTLKASADPFPMNRGQGDIDKLTRALLDGLTDAGVLADDSRVVRLAAEKVWADDGREGVLIHAQPIAPLGTITTRRKTT